MKKHNIKSLYYIAHIDNVPSILQHGILSHAQVEQQGVNFTPIYDTQIVSNRRHRLTPTGDNLWHFANVYFQPRNPMLYRVIYEKNKSEIVIFGVKSSILNNTDAYISTGNAASAPSEIIPAKEGVKSILQMWDVIYSEWWKEEDGSKRKIMAECLVPNKIPPEYIHTIYVSNHTIAERLKTTLPEIKIPIIPEPHMFFQPIRNVRVTNNISLVEGDMFFSQMHTITISVNTVGVMGKGLASRTKYQFPDVYVYYQDLCKQKKLQMGRPYIYKREAFLDNELADDPFSLSIANSNKWFLLFATKRHWKENSDIVGIEQGLEWILENYKDQGVRSLAVPALGCGLGGLEWQQVGPLMCTYFSRADIPVSIYLPREQQIRPELLRRDFLMG